MLHFCLSKNANMVMSKAFGMAGMSGFGADNRTNEGTGHDADAWNRTFRQSIFISLRS